MKKWLKQIKKEFDIRASLVIIFSTLLLVLSKYHHLPWQPYVLRSLVFYLALPLLIILVVFKGKFKEFGFAIGDWKKSFKYLGIFTAIMAVVLLLALLFPSIVGYYGGFNDINSLMMRLLGYTIFIFGWEFLFRGFMLFGLEKKFGYNAILISMIPFVILHIGKPEIETVGTIISGIVLGYIALKTRNFWSAWLVHIMTGFLIYLFIYFL